MLFPEAQGMYDPTHEKDACGVGMIADIGGVPSRSVAERGKSTLFRKGNPPAPDAGKRLLSFDGGPA